ncbi:hypothetical protein FSP39_012908 [Pinctada imbricata]|uniref:SH3 domain-containing protein n=1 Tax=Pinctada imbricata TaxID=66713 RepID=A0AA88YTN1_PINIB|nr:hypothetical protein FSP39_012908 [Pinctada imbricata]
MRKKKFVHNTTDKINILDERDKGRGALRTWYSSVDVVVEFDYDAEQPDELTIHVGDVIKHVIMSEGGWWEGELNGKKGMFPDNFVKVIEKREHKEEKKDSKVGGNQRASVRELASKLKDGVHVGPAIPGKKKDVSSVKHKKAKVLFDYEPENEDELKIDIGDIVDVFKQEEEGWWEGSLNGKVGVFPSNFVEIIEDPEPEKTDKPPEDRPAEPQTGIKGKKIIGVGLGNIFQGGPIKLRSTAASETKEKVIQLHVHLF